MKKSEFETLVRDTLRSELPQFLAKLSPQPMPQPIPKPLDESEALQVVVNHMNTCTDPFCNVSQHIDGMVEQNYKSCPECSKIVKKEAKTCKHCGEDIETDEDED